MIRWIQKAGDHDSTYGLPDISGAPMNQDRKDSLARTTTYCRINDDIIPSEEECRPPWIEGIRDLGKEKCVVGPVKMLASG
jgi:hypothetical protein